MARLPVAASVSFLLLLSAAAPSNQTSSDAELLAVRDVYTEFRFVLATNGQEQAPLAGRATEVFLWRGGRWVHPGWHLDSGT